MCKVLIIPSVKKLNEDQIKGLVKAVAGVMTQRDSDGFGYAYVGKEGLYAERFLDVERIKPMLPEAPNANFLEPESDCVGTISKPVGGLIVHSRTSTNVTTLQATHPFVKDGKALIHNGVCTNVGDPVEYPSGNDSEMLFQHYLLGGMSRVAASVAGYYAVGLLDADKRQTVVFKDSTAHLHSVYVKTLGSLVFATTPEILDKVCKYFKEQCRVMRVKDNVHLTFDANGKLIEQSDFVPMKRTFGELDSKSLGYTPTEYGASVDDGPTVEIPAHRMENVQIYDAFGRELTYEQYQALSPSERLMCEVFDGARTYGADAYAV
jgi:predicted glutamine amidotransferase